eukprot:5238403-Alexandrium_andersonii.AAC.1
MPPSGNGCSRRSVRASHRTSSGRSLSSPSSMAWGSSGRPWASCSAGTAPSTRRRLLGASRSTRSWPMQRRAGGRGTPG